VLRWADNQLLDLKWEEIGEHYGRYRLHVPGAERAMARSLERYGQLSPVVVCRRQDRYELIDGFKRLGAVRGLVQIPRLSARLMEADERTAKAAIYGLNRAGGRTRELEEAWIIQALVREDGMSQVEVAELLGRHKSWVCRRLALIERLGPKAKDELRVGLLTPTAARQIVRLPPCSSGCNGEGRVADLNHQIVPGDMLRQRDAAEIVRLVNRTIPRQGILDGSRGRQRGGPPRGKLHREGRRWQSPIPSTRRCRPPPGQPARSTTLRNLVHRRFAGRQGKTRGTGRRRGGVPGTRSRGPAPPPDPTTP